MAMVDVVVPVYNCQKYLKQAVQSVLAQPYQEIEILLVDDGSTDNSPTLCDALAREYKNVHTIHQKNCGLPTARNVGIDFFLERGEQGYIAFLDSDDAWMPDSVDDETVRELLLRHSIVGLQSCLCNQNLTAYADPAQRRQGVYAGGSKNIMLGADQHFASMFYSKELLRVYRLRFPNVRFCEDKMFRYRAVYLADSVSLINRKFYLYRNNSGSLVHTRPFGIPYYSVILNAYLQMDIEMKPWANDKRGELTLGQSSLIYYAMEMQAEHFRSGGTVKQFVCFLKENPHYQEIFAAAGRSEEYESLMNPTLKFIWSNRIYGLLWQTARRLSYLPGVRDLLNKRKYRNQISL